MFYVAYEVVISYLLVHCLGMKVHIEHDLHPWRDVALLRVNGEVGAKFLRIPLEAETKQKHSCTQMFHICVNLYQKLNWNKNNTLKFFLRKCKFRCSLYFSNIHEGTNAPITRALIAKASDLMV